MRPTSLWIEKESGSLRHLLGSVLPRASSALVALILMLGAAAAPAELYEIKFIETLGGVIGTGYFSTDGTCSSCTQGSGLLSFNAEVNFGTPLNFPLSQPNNLEFDSPVLSFCCVTTETTIKNGAGTPFAPGTWNLNFYNEELSEFGGTAIPGIGLFDLVQLSNGIIEITGYYLISRLIVPPFPMPTHVFFGSVHKVSLTLDRRVPLQPGTPVQAVVGFTDLNGNSIGQPSTVSLIPGQAASVDLDANTVIGAAGGSRDVIVTVSAPPGAFLPPVQVTAEVFDRITGFGRVLASNSGVFRPNPIFGPQGLAGGQTMRVIAVASPASTCAATISFADSNGVPIGRSLQVNLPPGHGMSLDLDAATLKLGLGQRIQVQPILTLRSPVTAGPPIASSCVASSEVFDIVTGRTWTYQAIAQ